MTVWNYLPPFRAVAEAGGLQGASKALHVTPSALSRSLTLLEARLGGALFERVGRRLVLNARGSKLLDLLRQTMRQLDDTLNEAEDNAWSGPLRVWAQPHIAETIVMPGVLALWKKHARLEPILSTSGGDVSRALLAGTIDLAVLEQPIHGTALESHALGFIEYAVYAANTNPVVRKRMSVSDTSDQPFVAPTEGGSLQDRWPPHRKRWVAVQVSTLHSMIEATSSSTLLAALPVSVGDRARLKRVGCEGYRAPLFAARRKRIQVDPVDHLLKLLNPQPKAPARRAQPSP